MDLIAYLEQLPGTVLSRLYESNWTCQAVLRSLPPLAKQYIIRLLYIDDGVPESTLKTWVRRQYVSKHETAMDKLTGLQILELRHNGTFQLNSMFKEKIQWAVTGGLVSTAEVIPDHVLNAVPPREELEKFAKRQWETLLMYVAAGATGTLPKMPPQLKVKGLDMKSVVHGAGLIHQHGITQMGFQFLLSDTYHQLWALLREYISSAERKTDRSELSSVISFLLQLGFREMGRPWRMEPLSKLHQNIAGHMCQLGLLMPMMVDEELWLCPTRMALALAGGALGSGEQGVTEGFIIVETNYRVYAWTWSALHYNILRLFVHAEVQMPGMFVGSLRRESVTSALDSGITADQIIAYLSQHAHPQIASKVPVLPEVVADQIRLWQNELRRVQYSRSVLYQEFWPQDQHRSKENVRVFEMAREYARRQGLWLWDDEELGQLVCKAEGHEKMRDYIRSVK